MMAAARYALQVFRRGERDDTGIHMSIVDVEGVAQVQDARCSGPSMFI